MRTLPKLFAIVMLSLGILVPAALAQEEKPPPLPKPPAPRVELDDEEKPKTPTPGEKAEAEKKPAGKIEVNRQPGARPRARIEGNLNPQDPNAPKGSVEIDRGKVKVQGKVNPEGAPPLEGEIDVNRRPRAEGERALDPNRRPRVRVEGEIDRNRVDDRIDRRQDRRDDRRDPNARVDVRVNQRARLGVIVLWRNGFARITQIVPDSVAARAGMRMDDEIIAINWYRVTSQTDLSHHLLAAAQEGKDCTVHAFRGNMLEEFQVALTLEDVPAPVQYESGYRGTGMAREGARSGAMYEGEFDNRNDGGYNSRFRGGYYDDSFRNYGRTRRGLFRRR